LTEKAAGVTNKSFYFKMRIFHENQLFRGLSRICRYISRPSLSEERLSQNAKGQVVYKAVACKASERKKLERICRYISRPSLSEERLSQNAKGQVVYKLKNAYDNGTTHIVLEPLDLLARLASLVPRPRVNLTRFYGVFAPHFKHRKLVVPKSEKSKEEVEDKTLTPAQQSSRMTWSQRLKRVFNIDIETCPECAGKVKVIASIEDTQVIKKILNHLGLQSRAPTPWPPRGPPDTTITHDPYTQNFPNDVL
jgi:hypothetical protein